MGVKLAVINDVPGAITVALSVLTLFSAITPVLADE